ncbi:MAG: amidase family protein, partial [Acidimicrobiia bacterium]
MIRAPFGDHVAQSIGDSFEMDPDEIAFAGIAEQSRMLRSGEISSPELIRLYLDRVERFDPLLRAFTTVRGEAALAESEDAQRRLRRGDTGTLLGIPVAVKDCVDVA